LFERRPRCHALLRAALSAAAFAALCGVLADSAVAATTPAPPTPESATNCGGSLTRATPTTADPNLLNYKFNCDTAITAYTLVVNRGLNDFSTVDDFSSTAGVFETSGVADPKELFSCSGTIPGDGINCNAGAGGSMTSPEFAEGTFDTTEPYCASIPAGSPAGTQPDSTALVQLVVTDSTGAEDGPFRLRLDGTCPAVHVVKPKSKKPKTKKHGARQGADSKITRN
jgi:hypothetical protein